MKLNILFSRLVENGLIFNHKSTSAPGPDVWWKFAIRIQQKGPDLTGNRWKGPYQSDPDPQHGTAGTAKMILHAQYAYTRKKSIEFTSPAQPLQYNHNEVQSNAGVTWHWGGRRCSWVAAVKVGLSGARLCSRGSISAVDPAVFCGSRSQFLVWYGVGSNSLSSYAKLYPNGLVLVLATNICTVRGEKFKGTVSPV